MEDTWSTGHDVAIGSSDAVATKSWGRFSSKTEKLDLKISYLSLLPSKKDKPVYQQELVDNKLDVDIVY